MIPPFVTARQELSDQHSSGHDDFSILSALDTDLSTDMVGQDFSNIWALRDAPTPSTLLTQPPSSGDSLDSPATPSLDQTAAWENVNGAINTLERTNNAHSASSSSHPQEVCLPSPTSH